MRAHTHAHTHTHTHTHTHKRCTDCLGEGQFCSVEVLKRNVSSCFFEASESRRASDLLEEVVPDVRTEEAERAKAITFSAEASEFEPCVCSMKSGESEKDCKAAGVQHDKRGRNQRLSCSTCSRARVEDGLCSGGVVNFQPIDKSACNVKPPGYIIDTNEKGIPRSFVVVLVDS